MVQIKNDLIIQTTSIKIILSLSFTFLAYYNNDYALLETVYISPSPPLYGMAHGTRINGVLSIDPVILIHLCIQGLQLHISRLCGFIQTFHID